MRVLWICNRCIPVVAKHLNIECGNKEGWLSGLSEKILSEKNEDLKLGVCFPLNDRPNLKEECEVTAYTFFEDCVNFEKYDDTLEGRFKEIFEDFRPDVIHIFGTEMSHTLAACRACKNPERILIGIQGLCSVCSEHYLDAIPEKITKEYTLRDFLKQDNLYNQKEKYAERGKHEIEALGIAGNVTGRTDWDRFYSQKYAPNAEYHFMNETLRSNFYEGKWDYDDCEKFSIFVSQGDYPIKGIHVLFRAFPSVLSQYPDAKIYVAGNRITGEENLKKKILIGRYGKYLKELIKSENLSEKVFFLGSLNAADMKERYLKSNVFVSSSTMENSPNSVGEAMILGVPVISSDVGGVRSILSEEEGFFYPSTDSDALAKAICEAFSINGLKKQKEMCDASAVHAQKTHNPKINYECLLEIYGKIVKK